MSTSTNAASRLERVIRELVAKAEHVKVQAVLGQLCDEFAYAIHQPHARNGGLIGLAAAAIALGPVSRSVLTPRDLVSHPVCLLT